MHRFVKGLASAGVCVIISWWDGPWWRVARFSLRAASSWTYSCEFGVPTFLPPRIPA